MKRFVIITAAATIIAVGASTTAVADVLITSEDIQTNTIRSVDIKDKAVKVHDLSNGTKRYIKSFAGADGADGTSGTTTTVTGTPVAGPAGPAGPTGPAGPKGDKGDTGATGAAGADGADGTTNPSAAAAGYNTTWPADGKVHETIETCAEGEYVTGGGYSTWGGAGLTPTKDLGGDNPNILITVNAPYVASDAAYEPISATDSRFYADRWVVRGINNGTTAQIVRAWALCAPLPN